VVELSPLCEFNFPAARSTENAQVLEFSPALQRKSQPFLQDAAKPIRRTQRYRTNPPLADAAFSDAETVRTSGAQFAALQPIVPNRPLISLRDAKLKLSRFFGMPAHL
jgi:hypothetical protein